VRTLTLRIKDDYFDRFVSFLELFPKKAVKIEDNSKQQQLNSIKEQISEAMEDVKAGRSSVLRIIN